MAKFAGPVEDIVVFSDGERGFRERPLSLQEGDRAFRVAVIRSGNKVSNLIDLGKAFEKLLICIPEKVAESDSYSISDVASKHNYDDWLAFLAANMKEVLANNAVPEKEDPIPPSCDLMGSCLAWVKPSLFVGGVRVLRVECETAQGEDRVIYIRGI